jgi:hypothetical protein
MTLREDLSRLLNRYSVTEISKELSVILNHRSSQAREEGQDILSERLDAASNFLWDMEDFGV